MLGFLEGNNPERQVERLIAQGERLFQNGRESEGLEKFEEAANVLPEAPKPSLHLGRAYVRLKRYKIALKHYYKALYFADIQAEPGILFEIAQIYMYMKRYDIVEDKLQKVLWLSELPLPLSQIEAIQQAARKGLAHLYLRTGRISDAVEQQQFLLERDPENVQLIRMLAESYRQLGEYRESRILIRKAIELAHYSGHRKEVAKLEGELRKVEFVDGTKFGIKERLYAEYQSLCLGTAGDDGLTIPLRESMTPVSSNELVMTLRRLIALINAFSWPITGIVAADKHSTTLSMLVARLLHIPVQTVRSVKEHSHILVCQTCFPLQAVPLKKLLKRLQRKTNAIRTFALMGIVRKERNEYLPDILGIPVKTMTTPFPKRIGAFFTRSRSDRAYFSFSEGTSVEQFLEHCISRYAELPEEDTLTEQIAYYRTKFRPHLVSDSESSPGRSVGSRQPVTQLINQLVSERAEDIFAALTGISEEHLQHSVLIATLKTLYTEHRDVRLRRIVGKILLELPYDEGLDYLFDLFIRPGTDVLLKISLVETLGRSANRKISGILIAALQDPNNDLRMQAIQHLHLLDLSAEVSELFDQLLHDEIPAIIIETLRYVRNSEVTPLVSLVKGSLPRLLHHSEMSVVLEALTVLQWCGDRSFLSNVIALLKHYDHDIVKHALLTIGVIGDMDCRYHLFPFLEHTDPDLRYAAAESLTKLEHQHSLTFLMERLRQESPEVQEKLLILLGDVGSRDMVPLILQFAEQHFENPRIVAAAAKSLARWQDARSLVFMRKALNAYANEVLLLHYISLTRVLGETQDVEYLIGYLERPSNIRFPLAACLYQQDRKRFFHILQDGIRSKYLTSNLLAIEELGEIGDDLSLQTLFALFDRQHPEIDRAIIALLNKQPLAGRCADFFHQLSGAEKQKILQEIERAIREGRNVQEVIAGCEGLYSLYKENGVEMMRQFCTTSSPGVVLCGVMHCLARYDPVRCREVCEQFVRCDDITVANTAYILLERLK